ncbi:hypothetical protein Plhal703r1_c29g0117021 [Plasmopara halstedii]
MAISRYRRDSKRLSVNVLYILTCGFFIVYITFLISWQFGDFSYLASTEQLSHLRTVHKHLDDAFDVDKTLQHKNEEQTHENGHSMESKNGHEPKNVTLMKQIPDAAVSPLHSIASSIKTITASTVNSTLSRPPFTAVLKSKTSNDEIEDIVPSISKKPLNPTNWTISGYADTIKFLKQYQYDPQKALFLFFVCSDEHFQANDWSEICVKGKENVYEMFSTSSEHNQLVTIYAGSKQYWKYQNDFYNDRDLKIVSVPSILKWEGRGGRTSGMLVQTSLYDVELVKYLFAKNGSPESFFPVETVQNKEIVTVNGYDAFVDTMTAFEEEMNPVSTFLMMVAGRFQYNKRPWCPYCRYSELPLEYAFYSFAPKNSRLIRVEVTDSYTDWEKRTEFTEDPNLKLQHVPLMLKIDLEPADITNKIKFTRHMFRYDRLTPLRLFFKRFT